MRAFGIRFLKSALPTAITLAVMGYFFAIVAGTWFASQSSSRISTVDNPATKNASDLTDVLKQRLPLSMALWGTAFVLVYEGLRSAWKKPVPILAPPTAPTTTQEQLQALLSSLEQEPPMLTETPPPLAIATATQNLKE